VFGKRVLICVDRFHVARLYREGLETLRKREFKRLRRTLSNASLDELKNAHGVLRHRRVGLNAKTFGALREAFTDIHLTHCSDDDIGVGKPVRSADGFNLYLVDGRAHCRVLTDDPANATSVVLAEVDEED
jgi:hypothetical protein